MDELFDTIARTLARPMPRRHALRLVGVTLASGLLAGLRPFPASAVRRPHPHTPEHCIQAGFKVCYVTLATGELEYADCCSGVCCCSPIPGSPLFCDCSETGMCGCGPNENRFETSRGIVCCPKNRRWDAAQGECVCIARPCGGTCCSTGKECVRGECKHVCKTETRRRVTRVYDPETQCCTEGGIAQKYPIEDADYYPRCEKTRVKRAGREPSGKGFCGPEGGPRAADGFGRANFLPHCQAHDDCYDTCRSDRERCDEVLCNKTPQRLSECLSEGQGAERSQAQSLREHGS